MGIIANLKVLSCKNSNGRIVPVSEDVQIIVSPTRQPAHPPLRTRSSSESPPLRNDPSIAPVQIKKAEISIGGSVLFRSHNINEEVANARKEQKRKVPTVR